MGLRRTRLWMLLRERERERERESFFTCGSNFTGSARRLEDAIGRECQRLLSAALPRGHHEPGLPSDGRLLAATANKESDDDGARDGDDVVADDGKRCIFSVKNHFKGANRIPL